jgi:2-dehydropantoate 2-reductase
LKIVIIGAGAMGSLFAGYLAANGLDVWAFDIWKEHVAAIQKNGLQMTRTSGSRRVRLHATSDPAEPGQADLAVVFVKHGTTREAVRNALPMIGPRTLILTLQNGIGNVEILQEIVPDEQICFGLTTLTSELLGPGRIEESFQGRGETFFWPLTGNVDSRVSEVGRLFNAAGIHTEISSDVQLRIWKKLVVNACYNTLAAILRLKVGDIIDRPDIWPLMNGIVGEITLVARQKGIPLAQKEALGFLKQVGEEARPHVPSMLVDVSRKHKTEIECLNGAIIREARHLGIPAPFNQAVYAIVRVIEETYDGVAL